MEKSKTEKIQFKVCSLVISIFGIERNLKNLYQSLEGIDQRFYDIIVVHDLNDGETLISLSSMMENLGISDYKIVEGFFGCPGYTRNRGLEECNSDWVLFWDCDDKLNHFELMRILERFLLDKRFGINFIINDFNFVDLSTSKKRRVHTKNFLTMAIYPGIWRIVIRRERIGNLQFSNLIMGEDQAFLAELNISTNEVYFSNQIVYDYVIGNPNQITSKHSKNSTFIISIERIINSLNRKNNDTLNIYLLSKILLSLMKRAKVIDKSHLFDIFLQLYRRIGFIGISKILRIQIQMVLIKGNL